MTRTETGQRRRGRPGAGDGVQRGTSAAVFDHAAAGMGDGSQQTEQGALAPTFEPSSSFDS
ncbi:hypothetical protein AB0J43_60740 [Nonomuraea fuscirosea]